jgi:hypothetical protein
MPAEGQGRAGVAAPPQPGDAQEAEASEARPLMNRSDRYPSSAPPAITWSVYRVAEQFFRNEASIGLD